MVDQQQVALSPYERTRAWADKVGITDPKLEMLYVYQEFGEVAEALQMRADGEEGWEPILKDAIGDSQVTLTVLQHLYAPGMLIENWSKSGSYLNPLIELANISEGLVKPKKASQVEVGIANCQVMLHSLAAQFGYDFIKDCFEPAITIIEGRVYSGKLIDGTFTKAGDY